MQREFKFKLHHHSTGGGACPKHGEEEAILSVIFVVTHCCETGNYQPKRIWHQAGEILFLISISVSFILGKKTEEQIDPLSEKGL